MNADFVKAIDTVCKRSNIDLKISDIVSLVEKKETEETFPVVHLHCRNDVEKFEFLMVVVMTPTYFDVLVTEKNGSPYSCDNIHLTLDRNYNVVFNK